MLERAIRSTINAEDLKLDLSRRTDRDLLAFSSEMKIYRGLADNGELFDVFDRSSLCRNTPVSSRRVTNGMIL